jgi:sialic acid synthase SpsE
VAAGATPSSLQTFKADRLVTKDAPKAGYQVRATGIRAPSSRCLRLELTEEDHRVLISYCGGRGILFLSTPFEEESADFLRFWGSPPSSFLGRGDQPSFLAHVAEKGKPIVLSTGWLPPEVDAAVDAITRSGNKQLVLLQCVSEYPADPVEANLHAMASMRGLRSFHGFSDHTPGIAVAIGAAALGACVVEKHFTLDREMPGPDHRASLEPEEFAEMVRGIRIVESALGDGDKRPGAGETANAAAAQEPRGGMRHYRRDGLRAEHIAIKRPGTGILRANAAPARPEDEGSRSGGHAFDWELP